jgi:hypothetical protein
MKLARTIRTGFFLFALLIAVRGEAQARSGNPGNNVARHQYGQAPLSFEANQGQMDPQVKFLSRGSAYSVSLTSGGMTLTLRPSSVVTPRNGYSPSSAWASQGSRGRELAPFGRDRNPHAQTRPAPVSVKINLVGAASNPKVVGEQPLETKVNYFVGQDSSKWCTNVKTFARVRYQNVYPGIDLVYYGSNRQVEYDFVVAPGADPSKIQFSVNNVDSVTVDASGNLSLVKAGSNLLFQSPHIYQEIAGRKRRIRGGYTVRDNKNVSFTVAGHDRTRTLVIDPVLVYSTFLGGSGDDEGYAIAVDSTGNSYITGITNSTDFPSATLGGPSSAQTKIFVAKLNASGSALQFVDYFGGTTGDDWSMGIAIDSSNNTYVTGSTTSSDFPLSNGAYAASLSGTQDGFLVKLAADGSSILYSTYIGGSGVDFANAVGVDTAGEATIAGVTYSQDFPLLNPFQSTVAASQYGKWGAYGFVTKFSADGSALVYSTYIAGNTLAGAWGCAYYCYPFTQINGLTVDAGGNAVVVGNTDTDNLPVSENAYMKTYPGAVPDSTGFVSMFTSAGGLGYSTYLGGDGFSYLVAVAVDSNGAAYVSGWDDGNDGFPITSTGICDPSTTNCHGGIVAKLDSAGSNILYSTYLGPNNDMAGDSIQVDVHGNAFIVGRSYNSQFGLANPIQNYNGDADGVLVEIDPTASNQLFATFLGGSQSDGASGLTLDGDGNIYIVGITTSPNFPVTETTLQSAWGGQEDAFVTKISLSNAPTPATASVSPSTLTFAESVVGATSAPQPITVTNNGGQTLNISGIEASGDFALASSDCLSVPVDGSCTVAVTFTPTSSGSRPGAITFTDSAADTPQTVTLDGSGVDFGLSATSTTAEVTPGRTATYRLSVTSLGGNISSPVTLSCSGTPSFATCLVSPRSVTPGSGSSNVTVTVTTTSPNVALAPARTGHPLMAWLPLSQGFGIFGLLLVGKGERRKKQTYFLTIVAVLLIVMLLLTGCGGLPSHTSSVSQSTPAGTYHLLLTAQSGKAQHVVTLTLIVQ